MRLNVCVNEMAPFGLFASIVKGKTHFDSDGAKGRSTHEMRKCIHLVRMCSSLTSMVLLKVSCIFVHCVVCNRRRRDLLGIVDSSVVRPRGRQGEKPCVSHLRRSELSSYVGQHNSYTSYSQGYGEEVPMAPRPKRFVVR